MDTTTTRGTGLDLDYPQSLAVYDTYEQAQRAVDHLSDEEFPVENLLIVGTDLKRIERVTGRLTWGRVALAGAVRACGSASSSASSSPCGSRTTCSASCCPPPPSAPSSGSSGA